VVIAPGGAVGRERRIITSLYLKPEEMEQVNLRLQKTLREIEKNEVRYQEYLMDDAEYAVIAFGTAARVSQTAVKWARAKGIRVGVFRPISLFPFPYARLAEISKKVRALLVVEMNAGQMLEDVRLAARDSVPVSFFGTMGGTVPFPDDVLPEIEKMAQDPTQARNHIGWMYLKEEA